MLPKLKTGGPRADDCAFSNNGRIPARRQATRKPDPLRYYDADDRCDNSSFKSFWSSEIRSM